MTAHTTIAPEDAAYLELAEGTGRRRVIVDKSPFTIGRDPGSAFVLFHPYVSRHHAEISREGEQYILSEAGSRHGSFVNGDRVTTRVLVNKDILQFGSLHGPGVHFVTPGDHDLTKTDILARLNGLSTASSDLKRLSWFLEIARQLNDADKMTEVLTSLLHATLELAGMERGYVYLAGEDGTLELTLAMNAEGHLQRETSTVSRTIMQQAAEGTEDFIRTNTLSFADTPAPESMVAHNIRTVVCIPLRQRWRSEEEAGNRRVLGVLYLDSRLCAGDLGAMDQEMLKNIAREATALVESAQLTVAEERGRQYNQALELAAGIQQGLMAVQIPGTDYATVEANSEPCDGVGGDFFDVIASDTALSVALVDVSGKGMPAAILASILQGMLYMQLQAGQPLGLTAHAINDYLCTKSVGRYATMVLLRLHQGGLLEYINCGHIQPRLSLLGRLTRLETTNLPVGLFKDAAYQQDSVTLHPGARVTLASDGFTEAENADGTHFGEERLDDAARCKALAEIMQRKQDFCGAQPATDDCTIVMLAYNGSARAG